MDSKEALVLLKSHANKDALEGMSRFGINTDNALGVSIPTLRMLAKSIGTNHKVAAQLWETNIHEARILATMVEDPKLVSEAQMERWAKDFNSWDLCDQCCGNLFDKTSFAYIKVKEWSRRDEEYVKRAAFALIAALAVHDKNATNSTFIKFLPIIKRESKDERNFVKKAVNWALRGIGKRNKSLNKEALLMAQEIKRSESKAARWIATDALRELTSKEVQARLHD